MDSNRSALLDGDALRRDLTSMAQAEPRQGTLRAAALALLKQRFHRARADVQRAFESGQLGGTAAAAVLSDVQDHLIQVLYDFATKHFYCAQNPTEAERLAIVATGGYGRGQLAPQSDIDLLFARPYKQTPWGESVIEFVLQMLWDMGLKVGHATRSIEECIRLAKQDISIRTSLLEARYVWGYEGLFAELYRRFRVEVAAGTGLYFVSAKLAERDERHKRFGESRYTVEPNVKEGKGGLRDLQTLYWVGKYLYTVGDAKQLVAHQVFTPEEYELFQNAESFLWEVRFHLHYLMERPEDRLAFDAQPEIARRFGCAGETQRHRVETFMRRYFLTAKDVGDLTRIFCAALEEQNKKSKPLARLLPGFLKRAGHEGFHVDNGRLNAHADAFQRDPVNLLRLFQIADSRKLDVHPAALRTVTRSLDLVTDELRGDKEANRLFLSILTSGHDPERTLRWLNESGVFGRFIPDFGRVVGLMQFNMYHHYTVDEHLIRAAGNVAAIERGDLKHEHPLATEVVRRIKSREVLYAAVLLHDIAKGLPGDHSEEGARIAERLCLRWGLSPEESTTAAWLVRNHLVMSDTAQRRDITDPQTVRDFVDVVQSPEILRLLLVLTVADIRAVGPGVWNGWKGQLLRDLYFEADKLLGGSTLARPSRVVNAKAALAGRLPDFSPNERQVALSRHTDAYWTRFDPDAHERHARLLQRGRCEGSWLAVDAQSNDFRAVTEIVVATPDHPGLFAQLAGAITASGGSIVDAKIYTTTDGLALDSFSVQDAEGGPFGDASRIGRLRRNIERMLHGEFDPRAILAKSRGKVVPRFDVRPRVQFDNDASAHATVIEVQARDRPGLLYDITRALFEAHVSISSAMVATYGERAIDVFYVRDAFGHKITHPQRLAAVEARLLRALGSDSLEAITA